MAKKPRKKKNASGEGGYSKRKDGRYDVYLTVDTLAGPKVLRTTRKDLTEARKWLNKKKYERDEGTLPASSAERISFGDYLRQWLEMSVKGTVSRHTYRDYESKVRVHLVPALGHIRLREITAAHLQALYQRKVVEGKSARTIEYIHATAHKALEQAEAWDLVRKNVARHATPPKKEHTERRVLDNEQVGRLFFAARGNRFEALYILALTTGMRRGELLGLKWGDLDLDHGYLRVQRSLETQYSPPIENAPKRKSSKRRIKLMPESVDALAMHHRQQEVEKAKLGARWKENGYVFPSEKGTPMRGDNLLLKNLKPLLKKAGLPEMTFHELRHTFATLQMSIGEAPKVVQEILGHSSIVQTMDTYSHVTPVMHEQAAERLRNHLFGNGTI